MALPLKYSEHSTTSHHPPAHASPAPSSLTWACLAPPPVSLLLLLPLLSFCSIAAKAILFKPKSDHVSRPLLSVKWFPNSSCPSRHWGPAPAYLSPCLPHLAHCAPATLPSMCLLNTRSLVAPQGLCTYGDFSLECWSSAQSSLRAPIPSPSPSPLTLLCASSGLTYMFVRLLFVSLGENRDLAASSASCTGPGTN